MKFNQQLENITTYEAGKPIELVVREFGIEPKDIIKLASNENPYGCSSKVKEAVSKIIDNMALYPDDSMVKLKNALQKHYGIGAANLIIGSGSDQVIEFAIHAKMHAGSKVLMNKITFAMYEIYAKHVGAEVIRTDSMHHDLDQFYALYKEHKPDMIFLCTPNNPTGDCNNAQDVYDFIKKIDTETLIVVDGAYMEYAAYKDAKKKIDPKELTQTFENVLFLGTFSKAYGLGGMRVGYGIANEKIIKELYKLRPPFNITTLSLEAASVALEDLDFVTSSLQSCFSEMKRYEEFAKEREIDIIESYTNFITLCLNKSQDATKISNALLQKGMIVRNLVGYGMNAIRVTIGTPVQNDRFFSLFCEVI